MRNANTPSAGSSSRSMKFSTRHACASRSFRLRAVVMVMVAGALCNKMRESTRKRKREWKTERVCVWAHVHHQTPKLLLCLSFFLTMQWGKTRPMRPTTMENGEYSCDCCRFEEQTRDAQDKALFAYGYGIWNDQK
jgi:hypothetical protein